MRLLSSRTLLASHPRYRGSSSSFLPHPGILFSIHSRVATQPVLSANKKAGAGWPSSCARNTWLVVASSSLSLVDCLETRTPLLRRASKDFLYSDNSSNGEAIGHVL